MIKAQAGKGIGISIEANGDVAEIASSVCNIAWAIYARFAEEDADTAKAFRALVGAGLNASSDLWETFCAPDDSDDQEG